MSVDISEVKPYSRIIIFRTGSCGKDIAFFENEPGKRSQDAGDL
ncbi:hypothetical protein ACO0LF_27925 [Undibacterium sp. Di27W]